MNDMTIFQTDKWSFHFVKGDTFQNQLWDSESGCLVRLYLQCNKSNAYQWYQRTFITTIQHTVYVQQVILCMSASDALIWRNLIKTDMKIVETA